MGPTNNELIEKDNVGMAFSSEEEVRYYYIKYAKQKEFGMRRRNSRHGELGRIRRFTSWSQVYFYLLLLLLLLLFTYM